MEWDCAQPVTAEILVSVSVVVIVLPETDCTDFSRILSMIHMSVVMERPGVEVSTTV
jgi:hypothetical protein